MDVVTHALASVALGRTGLRGLTPFGMSMAVAAGIAADADVVTQFFGASIYLEYHRSVTHSLLGTVVLAAVVAVGFWLWSRKKPERAVRLVPAVLVCFVSAALHVMLDVLNPVGAKLLWPFRDTWYAADLVDALDPWMTTLLALGLVMPALFRLITEEIGAKAARRGPQRGAIIALGLVVLYCGAKYMLHERAVVMLDAAVYRGMVPLRVAAFPSLSPLTWYGVVETDTTLEELEVPLAPGRYFSPDRTRTVFKPEASPALEAAQGTAAARAFLKFARFPTARVERLPADMGAGYLVELRDQRFSETGMGRRGMVVAVELDSGLRVRDSRILFANQK